MNSDVISVAIKKAYYDGIKESATACKVTVDELLDTIVIAGMDKCGVRAKYNQLSFDDIFTAKKKRKKRNPIHDGSMRISKYKTARNSYKVTLSTTMHNAKDISIDGRVYLMFDSKSKIIMFASGLVKANKVSAKDKRVASFAIAEWSNNNSNCRVQISNKHTIKMFNKILGSDFTADEYVLKYDKEYGCYYIKGE